MTRTQRLEAIKAAAGRDDMRACMRLFCEGRLSRSAYDAAVIAGRNLASYLVAHQSGVKA